MPITNHAARKHGEDGLMITFILVVLAAAILVYALISAQNHRPVKRGSRGTGGLDRQLVASRWQAIEQMAATGGAANLKNAVSEADKLLDYALRQSGVPGETMGDRLKASHSRFSDLNGVWRAHKLRNALAHEVGFDVVGSQAKEALADFQRGLRDLGAL